MSGATHDYAVTVRWTGAGDKGTSSYTSFSRDHEIDLPHKPPLPGSSDPAFRGDPARNSPEELFVASLVQCHMLWFLHLAAESGLVVRDYKDAGTGSMRVEARGEGAFTDVTLHPRVVVDAGELATDEHVAALHHKAHAMCFIARSVNFPVHVSPAPLVISA